MKVGSVITGEGVAAGTTIVKFVETKPSTVTTAADGPGLLGGDQHRGGRERRLHRHLRGQHLPDGGQHHPEPGQHRAARHHLHSDGRSSRHARVRRRLERWVGTTLVA